MERAQTRSNPSISNDNPSRKLANNSRKQQLQIEMAAIRTEGQHNARALEALSFAHSTTSFVRDTALGAGTVMAGVVAGPAGAAAFRGGVGAVSHIVEEGMSVALGTKDSKSAIKDATRSLAGDAISAATIYVGGKSALAAVKAFAPQAMTASASLGSRYLGSQIGNLASTTVNNLSDVATRVVRGDQINTKTLTQYGANYLNAGLMASIKTTTATSGLSSRAPIAAASLASGVAATISLAQSYFLNGSLNRADYNFAFQNAASTLAAEAIISKSQNSSVVPLEKVPPSRIARAGSIEDLPTYVTRTELFDELKRLGLDRNAVVLTALEFAERAHSTQRRDGGGAYLEGHIYPVTIRAIRHEEMSGQRVSAKLVATALGHDVVEDATPKIQNEFRETFRVPIPGTIKTLKPGRSVTELVLPLTKGRVEDFPGDTLQERRSARDETYHRGLENAQRETTITKLSDRNHNLETLDSCTPDKVANKVAETWHVYVPMAQRNSPLIFAPAFEKRLHELEKDFNLKGHNN